MKAPLVLRAAVLAAFQAAAQQPPILHATVLDGGGQVGVVTKLFERPLRVLVKDSSGVAMPNQTVVFLAVDGCVSWGNSQTATTDANGVAVSPVPRAGQRSGACEIIADPGGLIGGTFGHAQVTIVDPLKMTFSTEPAALTVAPGEPFSFDVVARHEGDLPLTRMPLDVVAAPTFGAGPGSLPSLLRLDEHGRGTVSGARIRCPGRTGSLPAIPCSKTRM